MSRPLCPSMKQISDGETTTSSRPAFRGLTAASVMALSGSPWGADGNASFYHTPPVTSRRPNRTLGVVRDPRPAHAVTDFYDRHPINESQVLESVRAHRGHAGGPLQPEDLWAWDQDHYGGLG